MMDIAQLPLTELLRLLASLPAEIDRRRSLERDRVMEELAALARARGFVLEDLMGIPVTTPELDPTLQPAMPRKRPSPPVKYRHPHENYLTWTGRGKTPRWISAWLAEGGRIEELGVM
jgi:DNA-binding protein H-NS